MSRYIDPAISDVSLIHPAAATKPIAGIVPIPPLRAVTVDPTTIEGNADPNPLPIDLVTLLKSVKSEKFCRLSSATEKLDFMSSPISINRGLLDITPKEDIDLPIALFISLPMLGIPSSTTAAKGDTELYLSSLDFNLYLSFSDAFVHASL